jgi:hypothetical protein
LLCFTRLKILQLLTTNILYARSFILRAAKFTDEVKNLQDAELQALISCASESELASRANAFLPWWSREF